MPRSEVRILSESPKDERGSEMKVDAVSASGGMQMQRWQQMQQMQHEQTLLRKAQLLGVQYPNTEMLQQNARVGADALRVINQVDRTSVLLNETTREEARLMGMSIQQAAVDSMRVMDSKNAVYDAQAYIDKPKYDVGQYFDKDA